MKEKLIRRDREWSEEVRKKFNGKCPHCNQIGCAHHIIIRDNRLTRWLVENGIYCCDWLHRMFENVWKGKEKEDKIDFYTGEEGLFNKLQRISKGLSKPSEYGFKVIS